VPSGKAPAEAQLNKSLLCLQNRPSPFLVERHDELVKDILIPRPRPTVPSNRLMLAPESTNAVVANHPPRNALNCKGIIGKMEPLKGA
jgi:hypothetical protein